MDVTLTQGDDNFEQVLESDLTISADAGNDRVVVTDPGDANWPYTVVVHGEAGDDRVEVYGGSNAFLNGGEGRDILYAEFGEAEAYGGAGDDLIVLYGDFVFADGGPGNDDITVGEFSSAAGGDGDDIIDGHGFGSGDGGNGSDIISSDGAEGGAGDDVLFGGEIGGRGGDGSDVIISGYEASGEAGNDILDAVYGNIGGAGRDSFFPLEGLNFVEDEEVDGGGYYYTDYGVYDYEPGVDAVVLPYEVYLVDAFTGRANQVVSTAAGTSWDFNGDGTGDFTAYALKSLTQDDFLVERFFGGIWPGASNDDVAGLATNDFIYGGGGDDNLSGGGGVDFVLGGFGNDALNGNAGDDLLVGHAGNDRTYGGSGDDELDGGDGDDTLSGSVGDDFAYGGWGNDLLAGGDGNDRLLGELGEDRLNGGAGNDVLDGGAGRDTLIGGAGKDIMTGGAGPDQFLFMTGESRPGGSLRDVIADFTSGEDLLDLRALGITDMGAQVSREAINSGIILHVDLDGDGFDYADFAVQLTGVTSLAAGDLLI